MKKGAKLSKEDITAIALQYANTRDTFAMIAMAYNCSTSTISRAIREAIRLGYVSINTAEIIRNKADENANLTVLEKGYKRSRKVHHSYDKVIRVAKRRNALKSEGNALLEEIEQLKYQIATYNDTFSDSDEYGETVESLLEELAEKKECLRGIQSQFHDYQL